MLLVFQEVVEIWKGRREEYWENQEVQSIKDRSEAERKKEAGEVRLLDRMATIFFKETSDDKLCRERIICHEIMVN